MNLHQFRFVREAVRQKFNLTDAAKSLFTSQPGVSKAILELEDELGVDIFRRHGKRIRDLTDPGKKSVTGLHASAVRGELRGHMGTQPTRGFDGRVQMLHQNDSASALATTCGLTAMSGCTSSMRKVCCTVWLNTGAATSPPK